MDMKKPLTGVKVVEFAMYAAAPWTGRLLADMGAEVIKIEPPKGEPQRMFGLSTKTVCKPDEDPMYQHYNGNKRNIALNMKVEGSRDVLMDLLKDADIFITNYRMPALQGMRITYDDLKEDFPKLVYGHVSGYGLKGPDCDLPGFDSSAFFSRSGYLMDAPYKGSGPLGLTYGVGDNTCATYLAVGLLAALHKAQVTGEGDYVLVSLFGTAIATTALEFITQNEGEGYQEEWPSDRFNPMTPVCHNYLCANDTAISLALLTHEKMWPGFCKAMGHEEWIEDPRYATRSEIKKPENNRHMVEVLSEIFMTQEAKYWGAKLDEYDLPYSCPQHFKDVHKDEQAWANEFIREFTFPNGNKANMPNIPIQFIDNSAVEVEQAEMTGQSTDAILKEVGYAPEKIASLKEAGVIK